MKIEVEPKRTDDLYCTPIIQQTSFWSKVKHKQGVESRAFEFKAPNRELYVGVGGYSCTRADLAIFLQYLGRRDCVAYVPYGPEIEPSEENQGLFLEELSEILRSYVPRECIALRYDLNWRSHWCEQSDYASDGSWLGLPDKRYQEYQLNFNTVRGNLVKCNTDILPSNTIILPLDGTEEEILARMKPKTRYNIGLAERHEIRVRQLGFGDLAVWYSLYLETAERNGLYINDMGYFSSVLKAKMEASEGDDVQVRLLAAYSGSTPLAAMFLVLSSNRATYLYGASSSSGRNLMPTYALQWAAIRYARAAGCTEYDFFGISPVADPSHPMYGLYKFKRGFGGEVYHQMGCWDYPLVEDKYALLQASEMNLQGYYAKSR